MEIGGNFFLEIYTDKPKTVNMFILSYFGIIWSFFHYISHQVDVKDINILLLILIH